MGRRATLTAVSLTTFGATNSNRRSARRRDGLEEDNARRETGHHGKDKARCGTGGTGEIHEGHARRGSAKAGETHEATAACRSHDTGQRGGKFSQPALPRRAGRQYPP